VSEPTGHIVDIEALPQDFPTQRHSPLFWEWLGRTIATFGFLEETLGKAIFAFTATTEYSDEEVASALERWLGTLAKALKDPLGAKIHAYEKAVLEQGKLQMEGFPELISDLRKAKHVRDVLCHGAWRPPNENGSSRPHFINRKSERFETDVDVEFLRQTQRHVIELAAIVVSTVTSMGWEFPGSGGPGETIWQS